MSADAKREKRKVQLKWERHEEGILEALATGYWIKEASDGTFHVRFMHKEIIQRFQSIDQAKAAITDWIQQIVDDTRPGHCCTSCGSTDTEDEGGFKCGCGTDDELNREFVQSQLLLIERYRNRELPWVKLRWKRHRRLGFYVAFGTGRTIEPRPRRKWSPKWGNQDLWILTLYGDHLETFDTLHEAVARADDLADSYLCCDAEGTSLDFCISCLCRVREERGRGQLGCRCGTPDEHKWPLGYVHRKPNGYIPR